MYLHLVPNAVESNRLSTTPKSWDIVASWLSWIVVALLSSWVVAVSSLSWVSLRCHRQTLFVLMSHCHCPVTSTRVVVDPLSCCGTPMTTNHRTWGLVRFQEWGEGLWYSPGLVLVLVIGTHCPLSFEWGAWQAFKDVGYMSVKYDGVLLQGKLTILKFMPPSFPLASRMTFQQIGRRCRMISIWQHASNVSIEKSCPKSIYLPLQCEAASLASISPLAATRS